MPTAVLMMIGQTAVMKITKIADGRLSRNAASEIGSQASGDTVRSTWKIGSSPRIAQTDWPMMRAEQDADDAARPKPIRDALQRGQHAPAEADVLRAGDEERIDDQVAWHPSRSAWATAASRPASCTGSARPQDAAAKHDRAAARTSRRDRFSIGEQPCAASKLGLGGCEPDDIGAGAPAQPAARSRLRLENWHGHWALLRSEGSAGRVRRGPACSSDLDTLDRQALEVRVRIFRIEHLAVEEGLLAARRRGRNVGRRDAERLAPRHATGLRG